MSDLRFDPISGIWVAIARKRRERPMEFVPMEQIQKQIICPFCRGNEEETPDPIVAYGANQRPMVETDDPSSWTVRIMPNKYPSLSLAQGDAVCGPYTCTPADGWQELVIPTPRHVASISELTVDELSFAWLCCQKRLAELRQNETLEHTMLFFNCRSAAGASLEHIHLQIMATPVLSPFLKLRCDRYDDSWAKTGQTLMSELLNWELEQGSRIVRKTDNLVMFCPYASRFAFQAWIVPKDSDLSFLEMGSQFNDELAELCHAYVSKLESIHEYPAYNMMLNLAPSKYQGKDHWFVEFVPRLNRMAGFELGTDVWVNPVPPDLAVRRLSMG